MPFFKFKMFLFFIWSLLTLLLRLCLEKFYPCFYQIPFAILLPTCVCRSLLDICSLPLWKYLVRKIKLSFLMNLKHTLVGFGIISLLILAIMIRPTYLEHGVEEYQALLKFWDTTLMISNFLVCIFAGAAFIRNFHLFDQWETVGNILALYCFIFVVRFGFYSIISGY